MTKLRLGFLINPYAGVGGPAALKGSDLAELQLAASEGRVPLRAPPRAHTFWQRLEPVLETLDVIAAPGQMGADWLAQWQIACVSIALDVPALTTAEHTQQAAKAMLAAGVDLLVFVGGDGTARDVFSAVGERVLVLGIPAGVKMHSGVYAINPQCAAEVVAQLASGELVAESVQEVRDIDEVLFRQGVVKARYFGEMRVPCAAEFVQAVKQGGMEVEALVLVDIADHLREQFDDGALIIWAPGSTTLGVLREWGHEGTLLGVDVLLPSKLLVKDVDALQLHALLAQHAGPIELVLTAIGGQGHIIGRGNQQISAELLSRIGRDHMHVIATRTKLKSLQGRPLLLDSGSPELDSEWSGLISVIAGYNDLLLYPVGY
ncbi:MAG TPA: ATP-NAD kinase family protein [Marinagarivorans sp.]